MRTLLLKQSSERENVKIVRLFQHFFGVTVDNQSAVILLE